MIFKLVIIVLFVKTLNCEEIELIESPYDFQSYEVTGPTCIPLKSKNINSNPYHASLISISGAEVRKGFGKPIRLKQNGIICPKDHPQPCVYSLSKSIETRISNEFSVSFSTSESFSVSLGSQKSESTGNTATQSIGSSIENSVSDSITKANEEVMSNLLGESLQKTHEKATSFSITRAQEESKTLTISQEKTDSGTYTTEITNSKAQTNEKSQTNQTGGMQSDTDSNTKENEKSKSSTWNAEAGIDLKFFKAGGGYSRTNAESERDSNTKSKANETNWNTGMTQSGGITNTDSNSTSTSNTNSISNSNSNAKSASHSSSSTKDNRVSDAISVSHEASKTTTLSNQNTTSLSNTTGFMYRIDDSKTKNTEKSFLNSKTQTNEATNSINEAKSVSHSYSITLSQELTFSINPGASQVPVCIPYVKHVVIPYACENKIVPVQLMLIDSENNENANCYITMMDSSAIEQSQQSFTELNKTPQRKANTLSFNEFLKPVGENSKNSLNGRFKLELLPSGNLVLFDEDSIIWQNEMGLFDSYENIRIRINERGHLIEEVKGLFNKTAPNYRDGEWITVWSSAPINHNLVTIGVSTDVSGRVGYHLIIDDFGDLNLYDAYGVLIWSGTKANAKHSKGYKFPETYLVPFDFVTAKDPSDKHNTIEGAIYLREDLDNGMYSVDKKCETLASSEAMQSENKRFTLILEASGNLILKDEWRTMWESSTAFMPNTIAPYELLISVSGNLIILDFHLRVIWISESLNDKKLSNPFMLKLNDNGSLVVNDANQRKVWTTWPTSNLNESFSFMDPYQVYNYHFSQCSQLRKNSFQFLNTSFNSIGLKQYLHSPSFRWKLFIHPNKDKLVLTDGLITISLFKSVKKKLNKLELLNNGQLALYDSDENVVWSTKSFKKAEYKLEIDNYGISTVTNLKSNETFWSFPFSKHENVQISGFSYLFKNFSSLKSCYEFCLRDQFCQAVSFKKFDCRLFNGTFQALKELNSISYTKKEFIFKDAIESINVKLIGHFKEMKVSNKKECWKNCIHNTKCIAVSFKNIKCFLFNSTKRFVLREGYLSLGHQKWYDNFKEYSNIMFINEFKAFENLGSTKECKSYCESDSNCIGITIAKDKCLLFNLTEEYQKRADATSYSMKSLDFKKNFKYDNFKLSNCFKKFNVNNINKCWKKCIAHLNCSGVSFSNESCLLCDYKYSIEINEKFTTLTTQILNYTIPEIKIRKLKNGIEAFSFDDGSFYNGSWLNDKQNGEGFMRFSNNDTYEGSWIDGKRNGKGLFVYSNGERFDGLWANDKREGAGIFIYNNGDVFKGIWREDLRNGNGSLIRNSNYDNNNEVKGVWCNNTLKKVFYDDFEWYEGDFSNELKRHGRGRMMFENKNQYEGEWNDDQMHGNGVYIWNDGDRYEGKWLNGMKHGKGFVIYNDGSKYSREYFLDELIE